MYNKLIILILIILIVLILIKLNNIKLNFKLKKPLLKNDVYYLENFLSDYEFNIIKNILYSIPKNKLKNENYRHIYPLPHSKIYDIFYSKDIINRIENVVNDKLFKSDFPIEYRIYPTHSKGMHCHKDTLLYKKPQYELVFTITNTSDSYTQWTDYNNPNKINKIYTKPNSAIIVKADGNVHCVSGLSIGTRSILKLIYTPTHDYNDNYLLEMKRFKF